MVEHETAMLAYARLARIAHDRQQQLGCHRFLLLTGVSACRAGWLEVAAHCRELIVTRNPKHFLARSASFPDAIRNPDNSGYFAHLDRFCSFEQAEYLLDEHGGYPAISVDSTAGATALCELQGVS